MLSRRPYPVHPRRTEKSKRNRDRVGLYKSLYPRALYVNGIRQVTIRNLTTGAVTTTYSTRTAARYIVSSGTIVQGNFHAPNAWTYDVKRIRKWFGVQISYQPNGNPKQHSTVSGFHDTTEISSPAWDQSAVYNRALEKLNSKARGDLDLGVAIAEAGQTIRMIRSLKRFNVFAKKRSSPPKKGGPKYWEDKFGGSKDVANGWLQYQYGWKPLMSDIFGAADESLRIVINQLQRFKAGVRMPVAGSGDILYRSVEGVNAKVKREGQGIQACTIAIELEVPSFDLARWSSLNPVSLGWELVPYSFVVDWFYDVGSYLRNMETALLFNTRFRSGYISELFVWDGKEVCDNSVVYPIGATETRWFQGCESLIRQRKFVRSKLTSYPLPRKPTFKVDLGSERLFSAASLLRQLIRR